MIYRALVRDNRDPASKGRIKVAIPQISGKDVTDWIWPVVSAGFMVTPRAGDQVWVTFEAGDKETPVWIGKTDVTGTYVTQSGQSGSVSQLLDRIASLEASNAHLITEIEVLKNRISSLE